MCCERVVKEGGFLCDDPLRAPKCARSSAAHLGPNFASTPPCLDPHELIILWFAPSCARACVVPASRASIAIATSGALVARRYHLQDRVSFLENWKPVLCRLRDASLPFPLEFSLISSHKTVSQESLTALSLFRETQASKRDELVARALQEVFSPLEGILRDSGVTAHDQSVGYRRYFLPRRLPSCSSAMDMLEGGSLLPRTLVGTGVGAWGPWLFLRTTDGVIKLMNCSVLLGRHVADSPSLFGGDVFEPLPAFETGLEPLLPSSNPAGTRGSMKQSPVTETGTTIHFEGGE